MIIIFNTIAKHKLAIFVIQKLRKNFKKCNINSQLIAQAKVKLSPHTDMQNVSILLRPTFGFSRKSADLDLSFIEIKLIVSMNSKEVQLISFRNLKILPQPMVVWL
jgi:hypothetical protein